MSFEAHQELIRRMARTAIAFLPVAPSEPQPFPADRGASEIRSSGMRRLRC
jgi:hypothetical protein